MRILIFIFLLITGFQCFSQSNYPVPKVDDLLFYIQHNRGKNTFLYQINVDKKGNINNTKPIKISRQLFDNKGEIKSLTAIQKNFAYGLDIKELDKDKYEITLVSFPKQKLYLIINDNKGHVETIINGQKMILKRLFIQQKDGTSGLNTKVDYIIFHGLNNGQPVEQKLIPK